MEVSPHLVLDFNLDFSWFFNLKDSRIALLILEEEKKKKHTENHTKWERVKGPVFIQLQIETSSLVCIHIPVP